MSDEVEERTLRDEFAIAALNATLIRWEEHRNTPERIAERAYEIADAMLNARKAKVRTPSPTS